MHVCDPLHVPLPSPTLTHMLSSAPLLSLDGQNVMFHQDNLPCYTFRARARTWFGCFFSLRKKIKRTLVVNKKDQNVHKTGEPWVLKKVNIFFLKSSASAEQQAIPC